MMRYYLPTPYIQVYAYEVRLLGRETLRVGFRPVSVPDLEQAYLVDHTYGMFFEDRLQVTTSQKGCWSTSATGGYRNRWRRPLPRHGWRSRLRPRCRVR